MKLNVQQLEAVTSPFEQTLVLACPGSGKTRVIEERIRFHLRRDPKQKLVAITFTNAAARELRKRLQEEAEQVFVGTIHAFALDCLRGPFAERLRYGPGRLVVLTEDQDARILATACSDLNYKGRKKDLAAAVVAGWSRWLEPDEEEEPTREALVAKRYHSLCRTCDLVSYDGLLVLAALAAEACRWENFVADELLVDEFQDVSGLTARFLEAVPVARRFVVGDPNQAIYSFLGGNRKIFLSLATSADWKAVHLVQGYRCPAAIVRGANRLTALAGIGQMAEPDGPPFGGLSGCGFDTEEEERAWLVGKLRELLDCTPPPSIAVLARTNFVALKLTVAFQEAGLPVAPFSAGSLPEDWGLAQALVAALANRTNDFLVYDFLARVDAEDARRTRDRAAAAGRRIIELQPNLLPPGEKVHEAWAAMTNFLSNSGASDETMILLEMAGDLAGQDATLAQLALVMADPGLTRQQGPLYSGLDVTTCHGAKGREFDHVFVAACEEKLMPMPTGDLEEERRLLYVAITRARTRCWLSWARSRKVNKWTFEPEKTGRSRFVLEALGEDAPDGE